MRLVYALPLLIALGFVWLAIRHVLDRRSERLLHERLKRQPMPPKFNSRGDSERSEMRAYEDATTVARSIRHKERTPSPQTRTTDGTRSPSKL